MFVDPTAVTALALPLSHVFGQTILFATLLSGTKTHFLSGIPDLIPQLPSIEPTFLALVPYALEKIRKLARQALTPTAEAEALERGYAALSSAELEPAEPVAALMGGRLTDVISGGASLDATTVAFYAAHGVRLLNCYGMTETATAVTVNEPRSNRAGTVGRPIPGTTVAIADDGEVLVGGANVSRGYWGAAADKTAVDSEGWLHTGDIGELDADGYLVITGRKKEILVTSGGKNVAPTPLEDRVRLNRLVSNCMVIGDGRPFITALITLDQAQYAKWRTETADATGDLTDPRLRGAVQHAVDDANNLVSRAESIREFRIVAGDFTVQDGLLTSSLKLKRDSIIDLHGHIVDEMYAIRV
jgi:long-chain acyl-CoA synthetase